MAILATARTTAFIPGASPPEVMTPIRFFFPLVLTALRLSVGTEALTPLFVREMVWAMVAGLGGAWMFDEKGWCLATKPMRVPKGSNVWRE